MKNKKIALIVGLLIVAIILGGVFYVTATGTSTKANNKLELAIKYLAESKYEEAILAFQEVIKIEPKNTQAYRGLSVAYSLQDKKDQAEQVLQDGLKQVTDQTALKLAMAGVLDDQDKKDQAEALYKELSLQDPKFLKYYVSILISHGKESEAETLINSSTDNNDLYESYNILAEAYFKKGEQEKALAFLNKSLTAKPVQTVAYSLYEKMYAGKWDNLISSGDELIGQNQVLSGQVLKLTALYNQGKYDEMVKQFDQASSEVKTFPKAITLMAEALLKQGNKEQGINLVKNIKTDNLKDAFLLANVAGYYLEVGDKETARKLATQGYGLDNTVLDNYVVLYKSYQGEDDTLAKVWLMKYLMNSPYGVTKSKKLLADADVWISEADYSNRLLSLLVHENYDEDNLAAYYLALRTAYLDVKNNIAYNCFIYEQDEENENLVYFTSHESVKLPQIKSKVPCIVRIHNPQLVSSELYYNRNNFKSFPAEKYRSQKKDKYHHALVGGVDSEEEPSESMYLLIIEKGERPLEDFIKAAGKSLDDYQFIDIE